MLAIRANKSYKINFHYLDELKMDTYMLSKKL